jgi:1-acyl-sn-glycerol-3-phosphate acyltransferase
MLGTGLIGRAIGAAAPPVAGTLRMAETMAADFARAFETPDDWFEARDPEYIRQTLPALRAMSELYFRAEVTGLGHIPSDEPVLLVGNHSGGTLIADTFVFAQHFYDHFGPERRFHQLAHDLVFKVPGARTVSRYGTVPASPENMRRALDLGAALLVYPGGDQESYRPTWESGTIDFAGRMGFAKLSLEHETPIVPVVAIGGQETALFLGRGRRVSRALGLDRALRLKVFPVQVAPPTGITLLDLPLRIPLPAKITIQVLPRIDLREELGAKAKPRDAYELVTERMQDTLTELADERTLPVLG